MGGFFVLFLNFYFLKKRVFIRQRFQANKWKLGRDCGTEGETFRNTCQVMCSTPYLYGGPLPVKCACVKMQEGHLMSLGSDGREERRTKELH